MINGDVDLTTNLDFYHDKKNKISSNNLIPWKKEVASAISPIFNYNNNITWYSVSTNTINSTLSTTTNNTYVTNGEIFTVDYDYVSWSNMSNNYSTTTRIMDNIYLTTIDTSNLGSNYSYTLNYTDPSSQDSTMSFKLVNPASKVKTLSIFGEKSNKFTKSPIKLCFNCGHYTLGSCKCNRRVPSLIENRTILERFKDKVKYSVDSFFMKYLKARKHRMYAWKEYESDRKIPWLKNLDHRIYEDYITDLFEEQDYSKYLTDMNWLRIH